MQEVLSVWGVSKAYPGVTAFEDVSFSLRRGEIRALCGENGAGKSTLVKILMGLVAPDRGSIAINGQTQVMHSPQQAQGLGLGLVAQELSLAPHLSILDKIWLLPHDGGPGLRASVCPDCGAVDSVLVYPHQHHFRPEANPRRHGKWR